MRKIKSHPKTSVLVALTLVSAGAALVRYRRAR